MSINIRISHDKMEAVAEVKTSEDEAVDVSAIKAALETAGVSHGVSDESCEELVQLINEGPPGRPVRLAVARGTLQVDGEVGSVRMIIESHRDAIGVANDSGVIDFHNRGSFTFVEKGQLIAKIVPHTSGTVGKNVCGGVIPARAGERAALNAGEGASVVAGGTELRATRDGDLRRTDDRIEVAEVIRVPGNLDFDLGSIECEGSVRVEGDVLPEFHIRAGGDVTIGGVVDGAEVIAGGDVVVRQGLIRDSRVTAKGNVKVAYISNSYVECDGDVSILKEVLHSTVLSKTSITTPATGRVVGGSLIAQKNIEVGVAGDLNGRRTVPSAGVDPTKRLEAAKLLDRIQEGESVQAKIKKIKEPVSPERIEHMEKLLSTELSMQEKRTEELARLQAGNPDLKECFIKIRKNAYPGVDVKIGPGNLEINEEYRSATFHYDPESGEVAGVSGSGGSK